MDLSKRDLEKLRVIAASDPSLRHVLEMYEQLNPGARQQEQEENDRRWQMMVDAEEKMAESEKPKTMGEFRDLLRRFGFRLVRPVPKGAAEERRAGHFGEFMESYGSGGLELMAEYEMMHTRAGKPRCDECRQESAMRCKQCGEHYCSRECQRKAWPSHKSVCKLVAAQRS